MKQKLFTLLTLLSLSLGANAIDDVTWDFTSGTWATTESGTTSTQNGLTLVPKSGKTISFDTSGSKTMDGVSRTGRLKFAGAGDKDGNYIKFTTTAACVIDVVGMSSKSGNTRPLKISVANKDADISSGMPSAVVSVDFDGSQLHHAFYAAEANKDIYIYSGNSGINLYVVRVYYNNLSTVTIGAAEYATFGSANNFGIADNDVKVMAAKVNGGKTAVTLSEVENEGADGSKLVNAGQAVVLNGTAGTYTIFKPTDVKASSFSSTNNDLLLAATDIDGSAGNIYVLNKVASTIGFYKLSATGTLAAGKAYLAVDGAAHMLGFDDETTGIATIDNKKKVTSNVYYNLAGQQVAQPINGLYIVNGKKIMVK